MPFPEPNIEETPIEVVHASDQPNPLNILLLAEAFTDRKPFDDFVEALKERFFRISPFSYCKPYINLLKCFIPSLVDTVYLDLEIWNSATPYKQGDEIYYRTPEGGSDDAPMLNGVYKSKINNNINEPPHPTWEKENPWRTIFTVQVRKIAQNPFSILEGRRPLEVIQRLKKLPPELQVPAWLDRNPTDIWLNPDSKSFGAIIIIANFPEFHPPGKRSEYKKGIPDSEKAIREYRYQPLYSYVIMGMSDRIRDTYPVPNDNTKSFQLKGLYHHIFAHELCHSLYLGDEYIPKSGNTPQGLANGGVNPKFFRNLTYSPENSLEHLRSDQFIKTLRWRHLMPANDLQQVSSGDGVFRRQDMEDLDWSDGIADNYIGFSEVKDYEFVPRIKPRTQVHWTQTYVIEGAGYAFNFFRSNFECKMRHAWYGNHLQWESTQQIEAYYKFKETNQDGECLYGSPEFCRVCNYQIRHHITGYTEFGIGGTHRNKLQLVFDNEVMPRLNKSFRIQNARTGSSYSTDNASSHIASIRAYAMFRTMPGALDVKLNIVELKEIEELHICLYFRGMLLDPTFYDMYRLAEGNESPGSSDPMGDSDLHYQTVNGEVRPFKNWEVTRGFVGTPGEIAAYFWRRRLRAGSYGNPSYVDYTSETPRLIVEYIYGDEQTRERLKMPWVGPAEDPEHKKIDPAEFGLIGQGYFTFFKNEWNRWQQYLAGPPSDGSLDYLRPLDMRLSLQHVRSLPEKKE